MIAALFIGGNSITRSLKATFYFCVVCSLIGCAGVVFTNRALIAQQMNEWHLLPQPQRLTELYFTNPQQLPESIKAEDTQKVAFTIHNLEHQTTTYRYALIAMSPDNNVQQVLGNGDLTLAHGQSRDIAQAMTIPPLGTQVMVKVDLHYDGITLGKTVPSLQTQSIHYLVTMSAAPTLNKAKG